ncbi:cysteine dioxygenase type 1 [Zeugodacus cucurbitae]|nr:cysteine dioxygenase type 1 [Zeugodacus cucurbitae]XP_011190607.1 cysteine dioxygenase type 1 [Zeugodacus cucurbitae]XP_011190608.1 cysteine dioxygenase type 1 [Zeugodacus cucurbitae]XP_028899378.1 cysteine dioxygenase type 1 [Zeugodacus cucurbitae]
MALSKVDSGNMDLEQERYLREATRHFSGIDKPLKYGPSIDSLNDLITALHKEFDTNFVNIEMVNHIMLTYKSNAREWKRFAKFDRFKYTRNLVDAGNGKFNLMILCWGEGQGSAIHDHADSHCFMKMLKGDLKETRYKMPGTKAIELPNVDIGQMVCDSDGEREFDSEQLTAVGDTTIGVNDVAYINDNLGLHRVENPSHIETAVSLHLYCPPFNECSVFHKNSGKRIKCPVTFWSKYGVRQSECNK